MTSHVVYVNFAASFWGFYAHFNYGRY